MGAVTLSELLTLSALYVPLLYLTGLFWGQKEPVCIELVVQLIRTQLMLAALLLLICSTQSTEPHTSVCH